MTPNTRQTLDDIDKAGKNLMGCGCLLLILCGLLILLGGLV